MPRPEDSQDSTPRLGPADRFGRRATDMRLGDRRRNQAGDGAQEDGEDGKKDQNKDTDDSGKDNGADGEKRDAGKDQDGKSDKDKKKSKNVFSKPWVRITIAVVVVVLIAGAIVWWLIARDYENTDDAFIDTHIVQISPQIAGQISALHVTDNQLVHEGDPIADINPADANARVLQVEAQKDQALAQIEQARATEAGMAAQAENAERDLARYRQLQQSAPAAVAQQQIDQAIATDRNAIAQRNAARAQIVSAQKQVKVYDAQIESAQINLGYTRIVAPIAGHVAQRTVALGNYVTPGQSLLAIVPLQFWVTANFKETQLSLMRPGQGVSVKVDACGKADLRGHVDSVQSGAGQAFGILPPENATGNYVKVVQRVPVKILLDEAPQDCVLGPGMSVEPRVKVR